MAFPGTYNISYYKGDTLEFRVYPKLADGEAYDLTDYTVKFSFSTARGSAGAESYHEAYAIISGDKTYVQCAIRPADAAYLTAGTAYVYDVEIAKSATPYSMVNTILTGNISVSDQVSSTYSPITSTTYTVTYYSDPTTYGAVPVDGQKYVKDQIVTVRDAGNITNPGNSFLGWTLTSNGSGDVYTPGSTVTMGTNNITLYAKWSE